MLPWSYYHSLLSKYGQKKKRSNDIFFTAKVLKCSKKKKIIILFLSCDSNLEIIASFPLKENSISDSESKFGIPHSIKSFLILECGGFFPHTITNGNHVNTSYI